MLHNSDDGDYFKRRGYAVDTDTVSSPQCYYCCMRIADPSDRRIEGAPFVPLEHIAVTGVSQRLIRRVVAPWLPCEDLESSYFDDLRPSREMKVVLSLLSLRKRCLLTRVCRS